MHIKCHTYDTVVKSNLKSAKLLAIQHLIIMLLNWTATEGLMKYFTNKTFDLSITHRHLCFRFLFIHFTTSHLEDKKKSSLDILSCILLPSVYFKFTYSLSFNRPEFPEFDYEWFWIIQIFSNQSKWYLPPQLQQLHFTYRLHQIGNCSFHITGSFFCCTWEWQSKLFYICSFVSQKSHKEINNSKHC